jgi:hypothetical protein
MLQFFTLILESYGTFEFYNEKHEVLFIEDLPNTIPAKFGSNCHSSFRGEAYFCIFANQKQELPATAMLFLISIRITYP